MRIVSSMSRGGKVQTRSYQCGRCGVFTIWYDHDGTLLKEKANRHLVARGLVRPAGWRERNR
jgi:hypothetical protein